MMCPTFNRRIQNHFKVIQSCNTISDNSCILGYTRMFWLVFDSYFLLSGIYRTKGRSEIPKLKKIYYLQETVQNQRQRNWKGGELWNYRISWVRKLTTDFHLFSLVAVNSTIGVEFKGLPLSLQWNYCTS